MGCEIREFQYFRPPPPIISIPRISSRINMSPKVCCARLIMNNRPNFETYEATEDDQYEEMFDHLLFTVTNQAAAFDFYRFTDGSMHIIMSSKKLG